MADFRTTIQDNDFRSLERPVQIGVLSRIDPDFNALTSEDKETVLTRALGSVPGAVPPVVPPAVAETGKPPFPGFLRTAGSILSRGTQELQKLGLGTPESELALATGRATEIPALSPLRTPEAKSAIEGAVGGGRRLLSAEIGERVGRPAGLPGRVAGAGAGLAVNEAVQQLQQFLKGEGPKTSTEAATRILEQGSEGAIGQVFGEAAAFGMGRFLLKPIKETTEVAGALLKKARAEGLNLSAANFIPGWVPRVLQAASDAFPAGRALNTVFRNRLISDFTKKRTDLVENLLGIKVGTRADVGEAVGKAVKGLDKEGRVLFQDFNAVVENLGNIRFDRLKTAVDEAGGVDEAIDLLGWKKISGEALVLRQMMVRAEREGLRPEQIRGAIMKEFKEGRLRHQGRLVRTRDQAVKIALEESEKTLDPLSSRDVTTVLTKIWKKFGGDPDFVTNFKSGLKGALIEDLEAANTQMTQNITELRSAADAAYGEMKEFFKRSPIAEQIISKARFARGGKLFFEDTPESVVAKMFVPKNTPGLVALRDELIKEGQGDVWDTAVARYLENLLERHTLDNPDAITGSLLFRPDSFAREFATVSDMLKRIAPDVWKNVKEFADLSKAVAPQFNATGLKQQTLGYGFGGALTGASKFIGGGIVLPNLGSSIIALGLMGKGRLGFLSKALEKGAFIGPSAREAAPEIAKEIARGTSLLRGQDEEQ